MEDEAEDEAEGEEAAASAHPPLVAHARARSRRGIFWISSLGRSLLRRRRARAQTRARALRRGRRRRFRRRRRRGWRWTSRAGVSRRRPALIDLDPARCRRRGSKTRARRAPRRRRSVDGPRRRFRVGGDRERSGERVRGVRHDEEEYAAQMCEGASTLTDQARSPRVRTPSTRSCAASRRRLTRRGRQTTRRGWTRAKTPFPASRRRRRSSRRRTARRRCFSHGPSRWPPWRGYGEIV